MSDWRNYIVSRILVPRIAALLLLLFAFSCVYWPVATWTSGGIRAFVLSCLITYFRLWDDLVDVDEDRIHDPNRVLCRTTQLGRFRILLILLGGVASIVIAYHSLLGFAVWAVSVLALGAWYQFRGQTTVVLNYHVVLLKYPVLLMVVAAMENEFPRSLFVSSTLCYLVLCVLEVWHDPRLRHSSRAKSVATVEAVLAVSLVVYLVIRVSLDAVGSHGVGRTSFLTTEGVLLRGNANQWSFHARPGELL